MTAPCISWEFDFACVSGWDGYDAAVREMATAQAADLMQLWTLGLYGGCPVTLRPMGQGCDCFNWSQSIPGLGTSIYGEGLYGEGVYGGGYLGGYVPGGGMGGCGCAGATQVWLPMPVRSIVTVRVGVEVLSPSAFRLDAVGGGFFLVRLDGGTWPRWQDMHKAVGQSETFAITLLPGYPISAAGQRAGAKLAEQLALMVTPGAKCALPDRVTNLVRQGVTMQLQPLDFAAGVTGIREIDLYLATVNPYKLTRAPVVWSPDLPTFRQTL